MRDVYGIATTTKTTRIRWWRLTFLGTCCGIAIERTSVEENPILAVEGGKSAQRMRVNEIAYRYRFHSFRPLCINLAQN